MGLIQRHPRAQLLALVEGRLDAAAQRRVEAHLVGCAACRAEAAELADTVDTLAALPGALAQLSRPPAGSWSRVWATVQRAPIRRLAPQLNLYAGLAALLFVLAAALPVGLAAQPLPVTAGVIQTPVALNATPVVGTVPVADLPTLGTALAGDRQVTAARPIPIETPVPGQKG
jgi:anti-sigma factor RsiW